MRRVIAIAAVTAACAGCGGGSDGSAKVDDRPEGPRIVLGTGSPGPDLLWGEKVRIRGVTHEKFKEVEIEASPYPYRSYRHLVTVEPDEDGLLLVFDRPRVNTRYRARVGSYTSRFTSAIPTLRGHFQSVIRGPHTIRVFLTGTGPRGLRPRPQTKVFFYLKRRGNPTYRLIGARPPRPFGPDRLRAGGDFQVTPKKGDRFFVCPGDGGMAVGIGYNPENTPVTGCGDRTIVPPP